METYSVLVMITAQSWSLVEGTEKAEEKRLKSKGNLLLGYGV